MLLNEYQEKAMSTAIFEEKDKYTYPALKLAGEAGEVAEKVGKILRDKLDVNDERIRTGIAKELGDVLWYVAAMARSFDLSLESIAQMNIDKLQSRKERGVIQGSGDER
jgi:NTP pyrophosphatase (non-canonical NTP hydrolase)